MLRTLRIGYPVWGVVRVHRSPTCTCAVAVVVLPRMLREDFVQVDQSGSSLHYACDTLASCFFFTVSGAWSVWHCDIALCFNGCVCF